MDMKVVNSIKYGWNTIALMKIVHLRHLYQNLPAAKSQNFTGTKTHMGKIFGI